MIPLPLILAGLGAGAGSLINKDDKLKGAAMGAGLGAGAGVIAPAASSTLGSILGKGVADTGMSVGAPALSATEGLSEGASITPPIEDVAQPPSLGNTLMGASMAGSTLGDLFNRNQAASVQPPQLQGPMNMTGYQPTAYRFMRRP